MGAQHTPTNLTFHPRSKDPYVIVLSRDTPACFTAREKVEGEGRVTGVFPKKGTSNEDRCCDYRTFEAMRFFFFFFKRTEGFNIHKRQTFGGRDCSNERNAFRLFDQIRANPLDFPSRLHIFCHKMWSMGKILGGCMKTTTTTTTADTTARGAARHALHRKLCSHYPKKIFALN